MTNYLLDTSVFLWSLMAAQRLNRRAREVLEDVRQPLFFSAASAWEISIKCASGKLRLPESPSVYVPKQLTFRGIEPVPITPLHALLAGELPRHHLDPFDRMLVAQAEIEDFVLMTADPLLREYEVEIMWCGK